MSRQIIMVFLLMDLINQNFIGTKTVGLSKDVVSIILRRNYSF